MCRGFLGEWDKDFQEEVSNRHLEIWSPAVDLGAICIQVNIERMEIPSEVQWQAERALGVAQFKATIQTLALSGCLTMDPCSWLPPNLWLWLPPNLWLWTLVSGSEPSGKNCSSLSVNSLPLREALPYLCFLTALLGQVWVLALLVQTDSTHVPRSGSFYLRGDRESELVMDVIPGFLSGTAWRPSSPVVWLKSQNQVQSLYFVNSVPVDSSSSCLILDDQVNFGCKDSWACSQLISSSLILTFALQKWQ